MTLLWIPIGLAPLIAIGCAAVCVLEGRSTLTWAERIAYGAVFGPTLTFYVTFLLHLTGLIPFTLVGFLIVQVLLLAALGSFYWLRVRKLETTEVQQISTRLSLARWAKILLGILLAWTAVKLVAMSAILIMTPVYQDDAFNNWNFRGKIYYVEERLQIGVLRQDGTLASDGVHSYPPTVPLTKTWIATLAGTWTDGLAGGVHLLWLGAALLLVYCTVRRHSSIVWALLGVYVLASLPLYMVHGSSAYADVFLSAHVLAALAPLLMALRTSDAHQCRAWLRIGALAAGLLVFTKNEAMLMHVPPLAVVTFVAVWWLHRTQRLSLRETVIAALWYIGLVLAVLIPWTAFKWANGLSFGNAKSISGLEVSWQSNVLYSLWITYLFEANWLVLPPVALALIAWRWRDSIRSPLVTITCFVMIVIIGQDLLFLFTGISTEALRQTGSGRGIVHLLPAIVSLVMILLGYMFPELGIRKKCDAVDTVE